MPDSSNNQPISPELAQTLQDMFEQQVKHPNSLMPSKINTNSSKPEISDLCDYELNYSIERSLDTRPPTD